MFDIWTRKFNPKEIEAKLVSADDSEITLEKDGKKICIEYLNIAHANTIYDFENM